MIKPNELRIGNLLDYEGQHLPVLAIDNEREFTNTKTNELLKCSITIGQYDDNGFMWTTNGRWLKHFKPIPLTEDWLLRLGFEVYEFDHKENQYRFGERLIVIRDHIFCDYGTGVNLMFVHSLQNLFFALTGNELELKAS
jgi:hypothetical protein